MRDKKLTRDTVGRNTPKSHWFINCSYDEMGRVGVALAVEFSAVTCERLTPIGMAVGRRALVAPCGARVCRRRGSITGKLLATPADGHVCVYTAVQSMPKSTILGVRWRIGKL